MGRWQLLFQDIQMKKLLSYLIFFLIVEAACAQTNLPACQGTDTSKWSNCFGASTLSNRNKYVGEFKDGEFNGQGTFFYLADDYWKGDRYVGEFRANKFSGLGTHYDANGTVVNQGIWVHSNFVSSAPVQQAASPTLEIERLRLETAEAKRKQTEAEEQSRLTQQNAQLTPAFTPSSLLPIFANRRALVIGNDTYKTVGKLENARQDARTIASNLTSVGYQVTLKLDLTEKEMKAALRTFSEQVQGGDEVMFFFAGHGVQLGAANYLLPTDIASDSEAQVKDEAIQLQRILDDMSDRKAKFTLAMIDACRDNPFKTAGRSIGGRGLAPTTAATGQMVIFSAGTGQQALDRLGNSDKNKNGLFTRVFVQEMQKPNQSIDRVIKNVRNQVAAMAKSVGHDQVPAIYDQVLGDFYFKAEK